MRSLLRPLALVALATVAGSSFADLGVGNKAPALKVANIVKGKQVNLDKGVHVVEFWATWCGPCKESIPHLTEMAKKYAGKVDFTGVSVYENGNDQLGGVKKFVAQMGPKMNYNVAFDGASKYMATNWMEAAKQDGIPTAFLVKDGQILWIGHPMDHLDTTIDKVLAGKYDLAAAKKAQAAQAAAAAEQQKKAAAMNELMKPLVDAFQSKNADSVLKALDDLKTQNTDDKAFQTRIAYLRFSLLATLEDPRAYSIAKDLADGPLKDDAESLNQIAWSIVAPDSKMKNPDYATAAYVAQRAAEASKMTNPMVLDTYGLALYKSGQKDKAIDIQTKAVELAKADKTVDPATVKEISDRLAEFKKG